jgi:hypothetical protein
MQVTQPRETADNTTNRAEAARRALATVVNRVKRPAPAGEFELIRPARWLHVPTGHHVETGYSFGEGRIRVFLNGGRNADVDIVLSGRDDDLDEFHQLFPISW